MKLSLSYAGGPNERVQPLLDGRVCAEGIDIVPTTSHPSETFWRQLHFGHFDLFEMSISSFLIARDQGAEMVAIPAFPSRAFMHTLLSYNTGADIHGPADLAGKRIGVGEYQMTAALWIRGILEHDFGVSQYDVEWYVERSEALSHGSATGFTPPDGIKFHRLPDTTTLIQMLLDGELDAAMAMYQAAPQRSKNRALSWNVVDRASTRSKPAGDFGRIRPLFPDPLAEAKRFMDKHGFVPANHLFALRPEIHKKYPWVAFNIYRALVDAKSEATASLAGDIPTGLLFGSTYLRQTRSIVGDDPFAYGVEANRPMLEFMIQLSHEQGFIKTRPKVEDLFIEEFHQI